MANRKIHELPHASPQLGDKFIFSQDGESKQADISELIFSTWTVKTIAGGTNITVDNSDPEYPIISSTNDWTVQSIIAWTNVTVDNTDPDNPIISSSGWNVDWGTATSVYWWAIIIDGNI